MTDPRPFCAVCTHSNKRHSDGRACHCGCDTWVEATYGWIVSPREQRDLNGEFAIVDAAPEVEKEAWHEFNIFANFKCYGLTRHVDAMLKVIHSELKLQFGSSFMGLDRNPEVDGYVWCHFHGEIHEPKENFYDTSGDEDCLPKNWQPVFMRGTDGTH